MGMTMRATYPISSPTSTFDMLKVWCAAHDVTSAVASFALSAGLLCVGHATISKHRASVPSVVITVWATVNTRAELLAAVRCHCKLTGKMEPYGL